MWRHPGAKRSSSRVPGLLHRSQKDRPGHFKAMRIVVQGGFASAVRAMDVASTPALQPQSLLKALDRPPGCERDAGAGEVRFQR